MIKQAQEWIEEIKNKINPVFQDIIGTESWERKMLIDEIDRLEKENKELKESLEIAVLANLHFSVINDQLKQQLETYRGIIDFDQTYITGADLKNCKQQARTEAAKEIIRMLECAVQTCTPKQCAEFIAKTFGIKEGE